METKSNCNKYFSLGIKFLFDYSGKFKTRKELAKAAGVSAGAITAVMRQYQSKYPNLNDQNKIAAAFGCTMQYVGNIGRQIDEAPMLILPGREQTPVERTIVDSLCEIRNRAPDRLWDVAKYLDGVVRFIR